MQNIKEKLGHNFQPKSIVFIHTSTTFFSSLHKDKMIEWKGIGMKKNEKMNPIYNKKPKMVPHHIRVSLIFLNFITISSSPSQILISVKLHYLLKTKYFYDFIPSIYEGR